MTTPRRRNFTCKCGADWMTVLPDVDTCQRCYNQGQPDIADWIKTDTMSNAPRPSGPHGRPVPPRHMPRKG